jgi:hypothetical protein
VAGRAGPGCRVIADGLHWQMRRTLSIAISRGRDRPDLAAKPTDTTGSLKIRSPTSLYTLVQGLMPPVYVFRGTPTPTPTATPTPGQITLSARGYKVQGRQTVDLSWSGATSSNVDVHRSGVVIARTPNDGFYTDSIGGRGHGSYTYRVYEAGTTTCSNDATVTF